MDPDGIPGLAPRLRVSQFGPTVPGPVLSAPPTFAGRGACTVPTGAGSTGVPALPQPTASSATAATIATILVRGLLTDTPSGGRGSPSSHRPRRPRTTPRRPVPAASAPGLR